MTAVKVKKPRKKKPYNLKTRITSALRKIWLYSPMRSEAVKRAKANGNKCEMPNCGKYQERLEIDHFNPCALISGWDGNWSAYIDRLFCSSDMLLAICTECHRGKTAIATEQRKRHRQKSEPKVKKELTKKVK